MLSTKETGVDRARRLALPLLIIPENTPLGKLNFWERRKLRKAIRCCTQPSDTSNDPKTLWLLAKIHQRLENPTEFLKVAIAAQRAFPADLDIITAATTAAIEVGDGDQAVAFSKLGLEIASEQDEVVLSHACLANLIAGYTDQAMDYAQQVCKVDHESCYLIEICKDVKNGIRPTPTKLTEVYGI